MVFCSKKTLPQRSQCLPSVADLALVGCFSNGIAGRFFGLHFFIVVSARFDDRAAFHGAADRALPAGFRAVLGAGYRNSGNGFPLVIFREEPVILDFAAAAAAALFFALFPAARGLFDNDPVAERVIELINLFRRLQNFAAARTGAFQAFRAAVLRAGGCNGGNHRFQMPEGGIVADFIFNPAAALHGTGPALAVTGRCAGRRNSGDIRFRVILMIVRTGRSAHGKRDKAHGAQQHEHSQKHSQALFHNLHCNLPFIVFFYPFIINQEYGKINEGFLNFSVGFIKQLFPAGTRTCNPCPCA